jgi:hypothetical protein
MTESEEHDLREEVEYWRRDAIARAWSAAVQVDAATEKGEGDRAIAYRIGALDPALNAIRDAEAKQWHSTCEGCGKALISGQLVHLYEEGVMVHVDCDDPAGAKADEHSHAFDDGFSPDEMAGMLAFARKVAAA